MASSLMLKLLIVCVNYCPQNKTNWSKNKASHDFIWYYIKINKRGASARNQAEHTVAP